MKIVFFFQYRDLDNRADDLGWKAKLKIPPKDRRIQTSVSYSNHTT